MIYNMFFRDLFVFVISKPLMYRHLRLEQQNNELTEKVP